MSKKTLKVLQDNVLFGTARKVRVGNGRSRYQFYWGRISVILGALALAAWFLMAAFLYFFFKTRRGYEDVQYSKMLVLPLRYPEHRREMGDFYIRTAIERMEARDFRGAIIRLRAGINLSPTNKQGRLLLSEFYEFAQNRPDLAVEVLRGGLRYAGENPEFYGEEYLQRVFRAYLTNSLDDDAYELATELLVEFRGEEQMERLLAYVAAVSRVFRGAFDEATALLRQYEIGGTPDGISLQARMLWLRGEEERAINLLNSAFSRFPGNDSVRDLAMQIHRERGDNNWVRRVANQRLILNPDNHGARLELLRSLHALDRMDSYRTHIDLILEPALNNRSLLVSLGGLAVELADTELADELLRIARRGAEEDVELTLLAISSYAMAEEYQRGWDLLSAFLEDTTQTMDFWTVPQRGLQAILAYGLGRDADSARYVREMFRRPAPDIAIYNILAIMFESKNMIRTAQQLLEQAHQQERSNQPILTSLIRLQMNHGIDENLPENIKQVLELRRQPQRFLDQLQMAIGRDRFMFHPMREDLLRRLDVQ